MAFVGIRIQGEACAKVARLSEDLRISGLRAAWVHPQDYHVTVKFIAQLSDDTAAILAQKLREDLNAQSVFKLVIGGLATFGHKRRPRVLWVGAESVEGRLVELASRVEALAAKLGLPASLEEYTPHVTIARFSHKDAIDTDHLAHLIKVKNEEYVRMEILVKQLEIMRRVKGVNPGGTTPLYESMSCIPFGKAAV